MKYLFLLCFCLVTFSCNREKASIVDIEYSKAQMVDDSIKYKMFCEAYYINCTAPYFVVFTVKNINTGEIKEICDESPFLEGALHTEMKKDYSYTFDMTQFKDRYFELGNQEALDNIGFDSYANTMLDSLRLAFNIDSFMHAVNNKTAERFTFGRGNIQRITAHLLYDYGVVLSRGCIAGNISGFAVYSPNDENWMWN